MIDLQAE